MPALAGGRYIRWVTTSFVVTTERLILRKGILRRTVREILLDRLTDITYNQTLLDRILGCGDILLESPGRDSQEVFPDLPHPVRDPKRDIPPHQPAPSWRLGRWHGRPGRLMALAPSGAGARQYRRPVPAPAMTRPVPPAASYRCAGGLVRAQRLLRV